MKISTVDSLSTVTPEAWDELAGSNLFAQHQFLHALEQNDCLQPWGWYPRYLLVHDGDKLIGASPTFIKTNSYGEFVFDWAWADAYERNNVPYYPKLVTSIPYTPAQGPRLLTGSHPDSKAIKQLLIDGTQELVEREGLSSAHWLFCDNEDMQALTHAEMLLRYDYQFHWLNHAYENFEHFLAQLSSKKRKNIRRERRKVTEANIRIEILPGTELNDEQWHTLYNFYRITFMKKSGTATLSLEFFRAMANRLRAVFAYDQQKPVAGAILFEGDDVLYGRHWGCHENYDSLHFEVCYYTGIEYCIDRALALFEPGAQGEHKIARGFLPMKTQSAHYIAHSNFRSAIAEFLQRETRAMDNYGTQLKQASPFKNTG